MNPTRLAILEGKLQLPSYQSFLQAIGQSDAELASAMFKALWHAYLKDKGNISLPYWADRFTDMQVFNLILKSLSDAGWITCHSIPARNWAEASLNESKLLEYCSIDELQHVRAHNKFIQYKLDSPTSSKSNATRINGHCRDTGLVREGFMKAGNTKFSYDQHYMAEYQPIIQANLTKSMDKIAKIWPDLRHDQASYDTISCELLAYHLTTDDTFTRGNNYNDSRGRAISSALGKVMNPISSKDARALLTIN